MQEVTSDVLNQRPKRVIKKLYRHYEQNKRCG